MNAQSWNCSYINNEDHRAFAGGRFGGRPGSWAMERKLRGWPHDHGPLVRVEMGRHCRRVREISRTQRVFLSLCEWLHFVYTSSFLQVRRSAGLATQWEPRHHAIRRSATMVGTIPGEQLLVKFHCRWAIISFFPSIFAASFLQARYTLRWWKRFHIHGRSLQRCRR